MHERNISYARASTGSSVRRRSGGATTFRSRADRASAGENDSFPSVHSLPALAMANDRMGPASSRLSTQTPNGGIPSFRFDDESYRVYPSLCTSDETEGTQNATGLRFINGGSTSHRNINSVYTGTDGVVETSDSTASSPADRSLYTDSVKPRFTESSSVKHSNSDEKYVIKPTGSAETSNATMSSSIDSGHYGLIPSVGTTNKFTHRWPRPKAFKDFQVLPKGVPASNAILKSNDNGIGRPHFSGATTLEKGQLDGALLFVAKWTVFKWCLLFSILSVFICGCAGLISALMTWFNAWDKAEVMAVADNDILILITLSGCLLLFTAGIGIAGTLLNSRPLLAVYTFLLWPSLVSLLSVGYTSYRRAHLSLDHKLNFSWSRYYTIAGRRTIQDALGCCGFYSSMHEASPSKGCYLRTPLPGCKAKLYDFERNNLKSIWKATFSLAPLHMINIAVALLCANHVTNVFGKRITPNQYRLTPNDVKADAEILLGGSTFLEDVTEKRLYPM